MLIQISSGQGPIECQYMVWRLYESLKREFDDIDLITTFPRHSTNNVYRSLIFSSERDLSALLGSIQWVWKSKFRPNHKRKNWFVDVSQIKEIDNINLLEKRDISIKTTHSGGPGGQNVNKVESAVTITDKETGIVITCREERSQLANKNKALARLAGILESINKSNEANQKNEAWRKHTQIERGNPIRVYIGDNFQRKI